MATTGRPTGGAGRGPRDARSGPSRQRRSRAGLPKRATPPEPIRVRRATLTARAAILAVAVASVALALALPFKVWVAQRGQIHGLQAQTKEAERRVEHLREQQARWKDPDYIKQQARVRLHYAMPGETTYVVLGKPKSHRHHATAESATSQLSGPWYSRLWQSVEAAGDGAAPAS